MADFDFDVLVIGAGPGGYVAAIRGAQLGLRVACAEAQATLGGTCLNVGCIPSKALLHASEVFEQVSGGHLAKFGIGIQGASLDLDRMHAEKSKAVGELTSGIAYLFKKNHVTRLNGRAAFKDTRSVDVAGRTITARNIVIATGSSVTPLPGVAVDGTVIVDSAGALALPKVPEQLVVIGGGVIGMELGSVWRRLGAKVTVVEYLDQILPGFDREVRDQSAKLFKQQGLELRTSTKVIGVAVQNGAASVQIEAADGERATLQADVVLVAVGRKPNVDGLELEAIGLTLDSYGRIDTDHDFRTAIDGIWAIGDCISGPMVAHKAEDEGIAVMETIAGHTSVVNRDVIPIVVYTMPEIAGVGLTEEAAKAKHVINVGKFPMLANSRAKANRDTDGFVKVIANAVTDEVLGVWIISNVAGTMIAEAAIAMEFGATSEDIAYTCHAHPTHAEALKEAAMAVRGKPIHI